MKRRIRYRPLAESDLEDVAAWYEGERRGLGEEFVAAVRRLMVRIAENSLQFPVVRGVLRCAVMKRFPYLICFVVDDRFVVILAIVHSHRSPEALGRRLDTETST